MVIRNRPQIAHQTCSGTIFIRTRARRALVVAGRSSTMSKGRFWHWALPAISCFRAAGVHYILRKLRDEGTHKESLYVPSSRTLVPQAGTRRPTLGTTGRRIEPTIRGVRTPNLGVRWESQVRRPHETSRRVAVTWGRHFQPTRRVQRPPPRSRADSATPTRTLAAVSAATRGGRWQYKFSLQRSGGGAVLCDHDVALSASAADGVQRAAAAVRSAQAARGLRWVAGAAGARERYRCPRAYALGPFGNRKNVLGRSSF